MLDADSLASFFQVVMIDLVLAGDNAIVIGLAAAGVAPELRRKAILIGIGAATLMRIGFALVATELLDITGLLLAGGLLLLWVSWKMYAELRIARRTELAAVEALGEGGDGDATVAGGMPRKPLSQAVTQIIVADVSMSVDNVLAVAGAAQHHTQALVFGLALSVALMGVASAWIASLLNRHRWIAWAGLLVILYVALKMIWEGAEDVMVHALPAFGTG